MLGQHEGIRASLVKLDVQGNELRLLEEGVDVVNQFDVAVMGVSTVQFWSMQGIQGVLKLAHEEVCRLYDALPMYSGPLDDAQWQCGAVFVLNGSVLVWSTK